MDYPWHLYIMSLMYIFAGTMHFVKPKLYMRIMPRYLPNHKLLVHLSGFAEILLGITVCIPLLKDISIYAIIIMLAIFLMVHFYMLSGKKASAGIATWILVLRIPLQFGLMYWAYWYFKF